MNNEYNKIVIKEKESFNSLILEFKEKRENVISIIKIVLDQKKVEEFINLLKEKKIENSNSMREFIKKSYKDFIESIFTMNEYKNMISMTEEVLNNLENSIQEFLNDFGDKYISKIKEKEELNNIISEKHNLKISYTIFAYLNKASKALKEKKLESSIQLLNIVEEKFIKNLKSVYCATYKRGFEILNFLKDKLKKHINSLINSWLIEVNAEEKTIGSNIFAKVKSDIIKKERKEFIIGKNNLIKDFKNKSEQSLTIDFSQKIENNRFSNNTRATKNIKDSISVLKNTSNINFAMQKSSLVRNSIMNQAQSLDDFDLITMVSNININFVEYCFNLMKKIDLNFNCFDSFIEHRKLAIQNLVSFNRPFSKVNILVENVYTEVLGYLIIQMALFELMPNYFTKRKYDFIISILIKELCKNLNILFNKFSNIEEYLDLQQSTIIFIKCCEYIGIDNNVSNNEISSNLYEILRGKTPTMRDILIQKYTEYFNNMLLNERGDRIRVDNEDHILKYCSQYGIILDEFDNNSNVNDGKSIRFKDKEFPFELPYTNLVIDISEKYKIFIDSVIVFLKPIYNDYSIEAQSAANDYFNKIFSSFIGFAEFKQEHIDMIICALISNNIKYCFKCINYYEDYLNSKVNSKNECKLYCEKIFKEARKSFSELIYDRLKKKLEFFISDIAGRTNELKNLRDENSSSDVETMSIYLNTAYFNLWSVSKEYISNEFLNAMYFIPIIYFKYLSDSKIVNEYNIYFILNLKKDFDIIQELLDNFSENEPEFKNCIKDLHKLIKFFTNKETDYFINLELYKRGKFSKKNFINFILRYKNLKNKKEMKLEYITEKEVNYFIKTMN